MALGSSMGCSVPQDRRLLWPYPSFCTPPGGLMIMSAWSCACAPAAEVPQFALPVLCDVPSSVLRWFQQVLLTISSLPMLSSQHLQGARQPRVPRQSRTNGVSSRSCNVRFMLRPARSACPALVRTFTSELSQEGSPPKPASDITSWLIVYYHSRIFPGRTGSLMGCGGDWTICPLDFSANFGANCVWQCFPQDRQERQCCLIVRMLVPSGIPRQDRAKVHAKVCLLGRWSGMGTSPCPTTAMA